MKRWISAVLAALLCCSAVADDLPSPTPLDDMIAPAELESLALSPDGRHVVGIGNTSFARVVIVMALDGSKPRALPVPAGDTYVRWRMPIRVNWIDNELVAIDFSSEQSEAIDLTGKKVASLGERFIRPLRRGGMNTGWALAYRDLSDADIDAVNAHTGERRRYRIGLPGKLSRWAFDADGKLLAVTMIDTAFWTDRTRISNWYRPDEQAPWQLLEETPITGDYWLPLRALPESNQLAVLSRRDRDTWAVFRYDTATKQNLRLMAGHEHEDVLVVSSLDDANFDSVITQGLKPNRDWFDVRWARLQASVDAALPDRINLLSGNPQGRVLVFSYGDVDPGRWLLLETSTMSMHMVAQSQSRIDPARMRPQETMQYKARDGLTVSAYLTRPARPPDEPAPMVVLIHGGPNVRDDWSWNEEVQILAAQGYVVFQPQFRGSTGFGRRFEEAGYGQWGLAMQDDITDGVEALITKGVADRARICIYGASYGGYAALWGVIKTPALYRCGISFAGVSDIEAWVSGSLFDDSDVAARELKRARIGDAAKQRAQLAEVSPLANAARVKVPLLIAHGEEDRRVLFAHSKRMVEALRRNGKDVEWMPFADEGHGLFYLEDKKRYYAAVLSFLQRHIGDHPSPAEASAAP